MAAFLEAFGFVPLLNAGTGEIDEFTFTCGAKISFWPTELTTFLGRSETQDHISMREAKNFRLARAFLTLWTTTEITESANVHESIFKEISASRKPAHVLRNLLWACHLANCGENDFWRYGDSGMSNCGIYLMSKSPDAVSRVSYIFQTPGKEFFNSPWSTETLQRVDRIHTLMMGFYGELAPRFCIANDIYWQACTLDGKAATTRLQLAVTALEAFYISPQEHAYIWDGSDAGKKSSVNVVQRMTDLCAGEVEIPAGYFEKLKAVRNDITHRGTIPHGDEHRKDLWMVLRTTELILKQTLIWSWSNQLVIAECFDRDAWPDVQR